MSLLALVVDDDPASLELARYLLHYAGFEVICAQDGGAALLLAAEYRPGVIVLDLDLPVLDGGQVRDRLAADPSLTEIPVVAMSVQEISEFSPRHRAGDFAGYVRKPLEPETFIDEIRVVLTSPGPDNVTTLIGDTHNHNRPDTPLPISPSTSVETAGKLHVDCGKPAQLQGVLHSADVQAPPFGGQSP
jgi:two-component system, cell cycle response regulator DivK